jgi:hypothetical protein
MTKIGRFITKRLSRDNIVSLVEELINWVEDYDMHQDLEDEGDIVRIDEQTVEARN